MTREELTMRPAVQKWEWDRGKPTATHGVRILRGKWSYFIARDSLRHVADRLHDIADEYDKQEARGEHNHGD